MPQRALYLALCSALAVTTLGAQAPAAGLPIGASVRVHVRGDALVGRVRHTDADTITVVVSARTPGIWRAPSVVPWRLGPDMPGDSIAVCIGWTEVDALDIAIDERRMRLRRAATTALGMAGLVGAAVVVADRVSGANGSSAAALIAGAAVTGAILGASGGESRFVWMPFRRRP
jgi:hypothetical protein